MNYWKFLFVKVWQWSFLQSSDCLLIPSRLLLWNVALHCFSWRIHNLTARMHAFSLSKYNTNGHFTNCGMSYCLNYLNRGPKIESLLVKRYLAKVIVGFYRLSFLSINKCKLFLRSLLFLWSEVPYRLFTVPIFICTFLSKFCLIRLHLYITLGHPHTILHKRI